MNTTTPSHSYQHHPSLLQVPPHPSIIATSSTTPIHHSYKYHHTHPSLLQVPPHPSIIATYKFHHTHPSLLQVPPHPPNMATSTTTPIHHNYKYYHTHPTWLYCKYHTTQSRLVYPMNQLGACCLPPDTTCYLLPVACCLPPDTTCYLLPVACCLPPDTYYLLPG